jgi:hypothetical protein
MYKECSKCGEKFSCNNDFTCWCMDFPKLEKDDIDEKDCLCKICLLERYRKKLLKDDEVKSDLFEEEYRYQWKNRH